MSDEDLANRWLLLIHQLPPKPRYLRVKVWRRLQALGAVPIKNSVYVLPNSDEAREDFEWLRREIGQDGGEASLCEARLVDGLTRRRGPRRSSRRARGGLSRADRDGGALRQATLPRGRAAARRAPPQVEPRGALPEPPGRSRRRSTSSGAAGREALEGLSTLDAPAPRGPERAGRRRELRRLDRRARPHLGHAQGVHVDRIASAWLIRRFVDPEARFKFVPRAATRRRRASFASTCSTPSSRTTATAARSRCCSSASGSTTRRCARVARDRSRHRPEGRQVRPPGDAPASTTSSPASPGRTPTTRAASRRAARSSTRSTATSSTEDAGGRMSSRSRSGRGRDARPTRCASSCCTSCASAPSASAARSRSVGYMQRDLVERRALDLAARTTTKGSRSRSSRRVRSPRSSRSTSAGCAAASLGATLVARRVHRCRRS